MTGDVIGRGEGKAVDLGGFGVRFLVRGEETGGAFALVEHPLAPRALAAPLHRHSREDEFSYVVEGRMGALLDDRVVEAGRATSSSSVAASGTRSGTPGTSQHACSS